MLIKYCTDGGEEKEMIRLAENNVDDSKKKKSRRDREGWDGEVF